MSTFTWGRFGISIVNGAFRVWRDVLSGNYQDDLHSVCLALFGDAVGFT